MNTLPQITLVFWIMKNSATTLGDFLTQPHEKGGLDFGTIGSSAVLALVLVAMIAGASYAQRRYGRQVAPELS